MPWLDPCGRKVDWLRSCYDVDMVFETGGSPVKVRWYFADDAQPWAPAGNQFVSLNWTNRESDVGDLGEQPGKRPWSNGKDVKGYPTFLSDSCTMDPYLLNGLTSGNTTGPWADGKLGCCDGAFDCTTLPGTLHVAITDLSGCGGIVGTFDIAIVAACVWQGGAPLFTLGYSMGAWFRSLACAGGDPTWTQVSFTGVPFKLVFDVADHTGAPAPALCCGLTGLDSFRVTITD